LERLFERSTGSLGVVYGRRRCGKSRLLLEVAPHKRCVYYVGDDREDALQRTSLAGEISRLLPGFDRVSYPDWDALLSRWWQETAPGTALILDEFPALVAAAPALPSLLQKHLDRSQERGVHLIVSGSSQRLMQGLILDRSAPLFGRATEVLHIAPLLPFWIQQALKERDAARALEAYSVWGGIPRYWELAREHADFFSAIRALVLSPLGVLYEEPSRLLLDDLRDTAQAASILSLVGRGCHRASEIAARLEKPATSLSRPLQRLNELGLIRREEPFGAPPRGGKKTYYQIADPFLRFWFRFVEPNRSQLEASRSDVVLRLVQRELPLHVAQTWEELARASVPRLDCFGNSWHAPSRWWGTGLDHRPMEIDLIAESVDGASLLIGEVAWEDKPDPRRLVRELENKADRLPAARGRQVQLALWTKTTTRVSRGVEAFGPRHVLEVLR
jgi:AAA+ ATPase superfamily predicted ATPase